MRWNVMLFLFWVVKITCKEIGIKTMWGICWSTTRRGEIVSGKYQDSHTVPIIAPPTILIKFGNHWHIKLRTTVYSIFNQKTNIVMMGVSSETMEGKI